MGRGLGLAELGNKAELDQLGWSCVLTGALKTFPGGGGVGKLGIKLNLSFSWGLGLAELGNKFTFKTYSRELKFQDVLFTLQCAL